LRSKRQKVKVTGNENVTIVFCSYLFQKCIDLLQTKTKMITDPSYTYRRIHFASGNASLLWFRGWLHVTAATWPCNYLFDLQWGLVIPDLRAYVSAKHRHWTSSLLTGPSRLDRLELWDRHSRLSVRSNHTPPTLYFNLA